MTETCTIDLNDCDDLTGAQTWKNLIFLKDGRSLFGHQVFPSQEAALARVARGEDIIRASLALGTDLVVVERRTGRRLYRFSEYSHCIQVPWRTP